MHVKHGGVDVTRRPAPRRLGSEAVATFGDRITAARKAAGLSQEGLARSLGVSRNTVLGWENKGALPGHRNIAALAEALGLEQSTVQQWIADELRRRATATAVEEPGADWAQTWTEDDGEEPPAESTGRAG